MKTSPMLKCRETKGNESEWFSNHYPVTGTFKVLFYVNGNKEKNGIVPVMGRVTINGSVAQFSCKQTIAKGYGTPRATGRKGRAGKRGRSISPLTTSRPKSSDIINASLIEKRSLRPKWYATPFRTRYGIQDTARRVRQGQREFQEAYRHRLGVEFIQSAGKAKKPSGDVHKEMP